MFVECLAFRVIDMMSTLHIMMIHMTAPQDIVYDIL